MTQAAEKHNSAIDDAVSRLLARADNTRGTALPVLRQRVDLVLEKYLFRHDPNAGRSEITAFIDEIRPDDLCLIIACERGDENAWEELVSKFDQTVKQAARRLTANQEDADDLAGSIWAELYGLRQDGDGRKKSKLAYYSGRGSLAGWLRAVVSQLAVDQFRKQSKFVQIEESREFENLAEESSNNSNNHLVVHHNDDPEELLTVKQTGQDVGEAVKNAIAALEAEDRLILKLYYFDDLKLKEIASTFGYHEATASRRLARIQTEIRRSVERELRERRGWTDSEVKESLAESAMRLGTSIEKMIGALIFLAFLQDFLG
jgi:RNA polymerase sigma-70 factor (ECF subfamily)